MSLKTNLQYLIILILTKSNNPFAYFTQIIYYAFVRRIQKEKKQTTIKHKLIMGTNYDDVSLQPTKIENLKINLESFYKRILV